MRRPRGASVPTSYAIQSRLLCIQSAVGCSSQTECKRRNQTDQSNWTYLVTLRLTFYILTLIFLSNPFHRFRSDRGSYARPKEGPVIQLSVSLYSVSLSIFWTQRATALQLSCTPQGMDGNRSGSLRRYRSDLRLGIPANDLLSVRVHLGAGGFLTD